MTATYWEVGRRIAEVEQKGAERAEYGEELLKRLSNDLTDRFGRGFRAVNLSQMRKFYQTYPVENIFQTVSEKSHEIGHNLLHKFSLTDIAKEFPLPWSHYVELLSCRDEFERKFYEEESLRGGWSVRQLKRQKDSQFYKRVFNLLISRNKIFRQSYFAFLKHFNLVFRKQSPFVLEFLNLKDEYSELELEESIIKHLQSFLLEMGKGFTFVGRQMRLRVGDEWFRVDLVLFNRRLKCLVIIDLKLGKFSHADVGQMILYTNYANEHWREEGENPPIGLILCDQKNDSLAHYTLENLPNKILASEYKTVLPDEKVLEKEIIKAKQLIGK